MMRIYSDVSMWVCTYICHMRVPITLIHAYEQFASSEAMVTTSNILFYCFLFVLLFICRALSSFLSKSEKKIHQPPSPPGLPVIGHLHLLGSVLSKSLQTLSLKYGPLMLIRIASSTAVVVSNAEIVKEMLKNNEMNFVSKPDFGASSFNIYESVKFANAEYGTYWRFMKKICMTELLSVPQVNKSLHIRREELVKMLEILGKSSEEKRAINLGVELLTMTNNMICRTAMSTRCSTNANESKQIWEFVKGVMEIAPKFSLGEISGPLARLDLFAYGRKLKSLFLQFDNLVEKIMVEHEKQRQNGKKESSASKDMMDILLDILENENAQVKLTRVGIKSFLMEIFMAGTETVGVALQWTLAELVNHPQVCRNLRQEINGVVGSKRLVSESDVPNLPYLQAVVKESLRLHPPTPLLFRKSQGDCRINGYDISANERMIFNLYAIMRDPASWENPTEFVPERFLMGAAKENKYDEHQMDIKGMNFNMFPFGTGRRGCPGASFALAVAHATVGAVIQCFDLVAAGGCGKVNTEEGKGLNAGMAHPILCYPVKMPEPSEITMDATA